MAIAHQFPLFKKQFQCTLTGSVWWCLWGHMGWGEHETLEAVVTQMKIGFCKFCSKNNYNGAWWGFLTAFLIALTHQVRGMFFAIWWSNERLLLQHRNLQRWNSHGGVSARCVKEVHVRAWQIVWTAHASQTHYKDYGQTNALIQKNESCQFRSKYIITVFNYWITVRFLYIL
jgi:hypothetical protein